MFYYTYKVISPSGKFYIGRHSTKKIDDGYMGSGKWVKSIKDKGILEKVILGYYDTFEDLMRAEGELLEEFVGQKDCMNFSNISMGAGGKLHWTKTEKARKWFSKNNPSKEDNIKILRREQVIEQLQQGIHNFQNLETIKKKNEYFRQKYLGKENPNNNPINRKNASLKAKKQLVEGIHNFNKIFICECCGKNANPGNYAQYHGDKCKQKSISK